ncbi:ABC transporter G family member 21-like [Cucurbita pepo subsp. pepo]|uniref:ABC transporter G family member 21-like n=1 Tax=Cucurbita pepo subsp. pepo TaxID=3664 RepID=UPI000C9D444E|nr:ABC transporter G family member 21-like [Cucurbita pepo subsp. pepo]
MSSSKHQEHNNGDSPSSSKAANPILPQLLQSITLKFEDVEYSVELRSPKATCFGSNGAPITRTILNGATGMVRPGEVLAMLGPSGSGKTTLLTALAGRLSGNITGNITYNGNPFCGSIKRNIGFVPQDDLFYAHLTVVETLTYAAMLRLPKTLTKAEKLEQVEMVINEMGLSKCRNVWIGSPLLRGISGGERKRVSIGHEIIMNPSVVLLDEPTSGLDSTTAERIAGTLRRLARGGRTVVMTIHQPSARIYAMLDKVLVMSEGSSIYSGDAGRVVEYFESIGYGAHGGLNFVNPADFLLDLANGIALASDTKEDDTQQGEFPEDRQTAIKQSLISIYRTNLYPSLKAEIQAEPQSDSPPLFTSQQERWACSWWDQFVVLLSRGLKERKHESYSGSRIFHTMSISIIAGILWWRSSISNLQDQVGLLFVFAVNSSIFAIYMAVFEFPKEQSILNKERASSMYRLSSYFMARTVIDLPMEMLLPAMFVTVPYWMSGLKPSASKFILTLLVTLLNVLTAQGLGLALGAILMDAKQASTFASVITVGFLMLGGFYIGHLPGFIAWLKYLSYCHHAFKLLLGIQYTENETYGCGAGLQCRVKDFPSIKLVGVGGNWLSVAVLVLMAVGFRVVAYVALRVGQPLWPRFKLIFLKQLRS